jgi:allophanate hydrolase
MISGPFDIAGLREAYHTRRASPVEVAAEALRRIAACPDPAVWITRVPDSAVMARAKALAETDPESMPLFGIPFAVKDNIDCVGFPTTAACPAFAYTPARSAHVVERLIAAGAILLGKTNLDQFATGLVGTRSPYGAPRSVFGSRYISGGSSSGSAVAVAAGLVAFALGTDTAGSGRVPAAFNNIIGLKPTRGLLSTKGVVPACRSLDCLSIFAQTAGDALEVMRVTAGFDPDDDYSRQEALALLPETKPRVGVLAPADREFFGDAENAGLYERAIARLAKLGATAVEIDFAPFRKAGALLYEGAWVAERLAALKAFIPSYADEMDESVRAIITGAARLSAVDAFEAQYALAASNRAADAEWSRIDVLLMPTAPTQYTVDEVNADPIALNRRLGHYTNFVNLLDYAAIAVPAGFRNDGLPFGVTLVAPGFSDASLAAIADRFHRAEPNAMGGARSVSLPMQSVIAPASACNKEWIEIFVVGAHLSGMPLNPQLTTLGAVFRREATTAPDYRLFVLPDAKPARPGLVRTPNFRGSGILGEVWALPASRLGSFVDQIPAPLGIGKVTLKNGQTVNGFLCEAHAVQDAVEITDRGGWRLYTQELCVTD